MQKPVAENEFSDHPNSRAVQKGAWKWVILSIVILTGYVLARNYVYLKGGLLKPNFGLIHQAYDFNLWELPMTLLCLAIALSVLSLTWAAMRKVLILISLVYGFVAIDLFILRYYVTYIEPQRIVVHQVRLETQKLTEPVRLLHISDIQSGGIGDYEKHLFDRIKELKPDLILNTGDLLQVVPPATFESEFPKLLELIKTVNPRLGTYAVFGDTERELYDMSPDEIMPLQMLSSRSLKIDTKAGVLHIYGLSLYQSKKQAWALRAVEEWLKMTQSSDFCILFGHAPDYAMEMMDQPIDLCLAGHTHGGQVRLPWYGPLVIYSKVPREWARGFRRIGVPFLNVSAGAGSNRFEGFPPMRFNCPTEMTLIELVPLD